MTRKTRRERMTINGEDYVIDHDGRVYRVYDRIRWELVDDEYTIELVRERLHKLQAKRTRANAKAAARRAAMKDAMDSIGVRRVRGARGGTYYE